MLPPGDPLPRLTEAGTVMSREPAVMVNVTVVSPVVAAYAACGMIVASAVVTPAKASPIRRTRTVALFAE